MAATTPAKNDPGFSGALDDIRNFARDAQFHNYGTGPDEHELPGVKTCSDKEGLRPLIDAFKQKLSTPFRQVCRSSTVHGERRTHDSH